MIVFVELGVVSLFSTSLADGVGCELEPSANMHKKLSIR